MDDQIIRYRDTRGIDPARPAFSDVVISGIADGGGLYVPEFLPPRFARPALTALSARSYSERALIVFRRFGLDLPAERLPPLLARAYGTNFDSPAVAPVRDAGDGRWILELWHGPTLAFKDMALQIMPLLFAEAVALKQAAGELEEDFLILVATSGDTGTAALEGFAGVAHTRIAVFYPAAGVSETQRLQMITRPGGNVAVFGVTGTFDDCQNAVKAAFSDPSFTTRLRSAHRLRLSSANSINWGRLLPQIVYYASAYADMAAGGAVAAGAEIDVCVPTGNFGNILAAWYARRLGVPIGRLLCASNENSVLTDFLATGVYELTGRRLVQKRAVKRRTGRKGASKPALGAEWACGSFSGFACPS